MPAAAAPGTVLDRSVSADVTQGVSSGVAARNSANVPGLARWLLPNLCAAVFAVTLFQVLFLAGGHALYRDSDTGWHILAGQSMIATGRVPTVDPYSFTRAGRPWFAWEWLADVAFGAADRAAGLRGVELLPALAIALAVAGSVALALRLGANFLGAAACAGLLMMVTSIHWLARPHIFGWLLALAFLSAAELHRPGKKMLWALPLLSMLWANVHGSFALGPAILLVYAVGRWPRFRDYSLAALLSLLATFANPYGWQLHQHVFRYLRDDYIMDHIGEFHSFDFHGTGAVWMQLFLLIAVVGGLLAARRKDWPVALLTLALLQQGLFAARHLPLAALLLLPLALSRLTWEAQCGGVATSFMAYCERLRAWDRRMVGAIPAMLAVAVAALAIAPATGAARGFDPASFPVQAASFFAGHEESVRVFATDQWGGYMIYRFGGRMKVFIDGRSDFYGPDFLRRYGNVRDLRPGWERVLDTEFVTHVMIAPEEPLAQALLLRPEWRVVRADRVAMIFERQTSLIHAGSTFGGGRIG
jgi:hypothetical protein